METVPIPKKVTAISSYPPQNRKMLISCTLLCELSRFILQNASYIRQLLQPPDFESEGKTNFSLGKLRSLNYRLFELHVAMWLGLFTLGQHMTFPGFTFLVC